MISDITFEESKPKLLVIGPQSSGKGRLISRLCTELGLVHIREAWLVAHAAKRGLPSAAKAEGMKGKDLSNEVAMEILQELMIDCSEQGYVIDGLPKNYDQAMLLKKSNADKLVVIDVAEADIVAFHANRMMDTTTMKFYDTTSPEYTTEVAARCKKMENDEESKVKAEIRPYFQALPEIISAFGEGKVFKIQGSSRPGGEAGMFKALAAQF